MCKRPSRSLKRTVTALMRCSLAFKLSCSSSSYDNERKLRSSVDMNLLQLIFHKFGAKSEHPGGTSWPVGYRTPPKFAILKNCADKLKNSIVGRRLDTAAQAALKLHGLQYRCSERDLEQQRGHQCRRHGHENHDTVDLRADHRHAQPDLRYYHPNFAARHHAQAHLQNVLPPKRNRAETASN